MPLDSYSPCPGGLNKKMKFCCADLLADWQKIERMLEGGQHQACLGVVERLDQEHPGRACLLATKAYLYRMNDQMEEAQATVAQLLEKHPDNPLALSESAIVTAALENGPAALRVLQRAIAAASQKIDQRAYEAMTAVTYVLAGEGHILAARSLASLQLLLNHEDRRALEVLSQLNTSPNIPLIVKDERSIAAPSTPEPWSAEFTEIASLVAAIQFTAAAEKMAALTERFPRSPALWRLLATVRAWIGDEPGSVEALRRLVALDIPLEDAVDAESLALFLVDNPLGDLVDVVNIVCPISDVERVQTALLSSSRTPQIPVDLASLATEDEPPPKGVYLFLDRTVPLASSGVTLETIPRTLCRAMFFGRQTDREARLELHDVVARDLPQVKALLAELVGGPLDMSIVQETSGQISISQDMFVRHWRLPADTTRELFEQFSNQYEEEALLKRWPSQPLSYLDGKSPQEAAGDEAYRIKLLAAICVLEFWLEQADVHLDCNRLRSQLGLPTLDPIDPEQMPTDRLPLGRLARVMVEKLSDDALLLGFRRSLTFAAKAALEKFARAVADRASLNGRDEQRHALSVLSRIEEDPERALQYVERGRQASLAEDKSCAAWDMTELTLRLRRGEGEEAWRLIEHLDRQHRTEPGVAAALSDLLVKMGVINPDGSPTAGPVDEGPGIVVPGQSGAEPGKLWTPDGQTPSGEKRALWTPDMG